MRDQHNEKKRENTTNEKHNGAASLPQVNVCRLQFSVHVGRSQEGGIMARPRPNFCCTQLINTEQFHLEDNDPGTAACRGPVLSLTPRTRITTELRTVTGNRLAL